MVAKTKTVYNLVDTNLIRYEVEKKENGNFETKGQDGKVVIFDFFTTWCPSCKSVAPHLGSLQKKYTSKLKVIGVLLEDGKNKAYVEQFQNSFNAHYPISVSKDNRKLALSVYQSVNAPRSMPIPLLAIFKDGKYINHYIGNVPEEMIESDIKKALN